MASRSWTILMFMLLANLRSYKMPHKKRNGFQSLNTIRNCLPKSCHDSCCSIQTTAIVVPIHDSFINNLSKACNTCSQISWERSNKSCNSEVDKLPNCCLSLSNSLREADVGVVWFPARLLDQELSIQTGTSTLKWAFTQNDKAKCLLCVLLDCALLCL